MMLAQRMFICPWFRLLIGVVLGLPTIALIPEAAAQTRNPCPHIYYEEPFNSTRAVPAGCPPNAATHRSRRFPPPASPPLSPSVQGNVGPVPPLPEAVQETIAVVTPINGTVDIRLQNDTTTSITYQVIGNTEPRTLGGGQAVVLRAIPVPATLTLVRPDGGFVRVIPLATEASSTLSLSLVGTGDLGENIRTLSVQPNGQVLAY
jgi:hypothetical protein